MKTHLPFSFKLDPGAELSKKNQIQDDGCSQKGVLAGVMQDYGVFATHENF